MVASWRPLLNTRFELGTFLLFTLPKSIRAVGHKHGIDSHREVWLSVVHLLNAMFVGKHPASDHEGHPWPNNSFELENSCQPIRVGRFFFVVWCLTGDLPYLAEEYGMPHFNSTKFCWMCGADRLEAPYTDQSRRAKWKRLLLTPESGVQQRVSPHPIWDLIGVARWHVPGDLMHTG